MKVFVNNDLIEVKDTATLLDLLTLLNKKNDQFIAVAINNAIVSKSVWATTYLKEKDNISIIQAVCGG